MEPEGSLPHSQVPATGLYPELELGGKFLIMEIYKIHSRSSHEGPEGEKMYSSTLFNLGVRWE
jgi:hypothetical protein